LWVPVTSRANLEQNYFNEHFGAFYRINTFFMIPAEESDQGADLFQTPYLELFYYVQVNLTL
jgi:hypothetical protein